MRYVQATKENPDVPLEETVGELKERLLKERGIPVNDALEVINRRTLTIAGAKKPPHL